ncbi:uncharacterized protein LAESUDRAFT_732503 [Laetiporus sulphureus 93-53]|uniref:Uncharacterized protein n=1 Tax=Laetiporus sulphureus 93-53 TaxID=1314785 RepID=A0A165B3Y8_9APHY|nr:uncharacterized protein LAESUDRAFT_732503 [Laetiporus sulphureus 93-53]KZT00178.1 hypothetical protein LAESUDRAFT_732503 [Laetiporus sulphureus 93-53]
MPTHKGISLSLIVDGEELPEVGIEVLNSKTITSIIPGDEGVEFAYEYVNNSETDILIDPMFDGHKTGEVVHCAAGAQGHDVGPGTSATTVRAFRFRRVSTSSDVDSDDGLSSSLGALGVLEFRIIRVKVNSFHEDIPLEDRTRQIEASLGGTIDMDEDHPWLPPPEHWENIDTDEDPYVIFRFQYKPRAQLRSSLLMYYNAHESAAVQSLRSLSPQPARRVRRGKQPQRSPHRANLSQRPFLTDDLSSSGSSLAFLGSEYHPSDSDADDDRMSHNRKGTVSSRSRTSSSTTHVQFEATQPRLQHHSVSESGSETGRLLRLATAQAECLQAIMNNLKDTLERLQGSRA